MNLQKKLKNRLIKYVKENFNAKSIPEWKVEGYSETFLSDLRLIDLPTVVEAFKGELSIDEDGDALVDNYDNVCLHIMFDTFVINLKIY